MTRYLYDTFTGADGTDLSAHAPDIDSQGGGWAELAGDWELDSNKAGSTAVANARAVIDSGISEGVIKADITVGLAGATAYLMFRSNAGGTNFWMVGLADVGGGEVRLYSATGLVYTLHADKSFTLDEATTYEVKVCLCDPDDVKVYVDDVLMISHTSSLYGTQTVIGLLASLNASARFDNLIAEDRPTCCYCTTADIKNTFGAQWTSGVLSDTYLETLIFMASRLIDREMGWRTCHYAISDTAATNRHYDTRNGLEIQIDRCLDDAAFAVAVDEQSNGTYVAWVRNTDYITYPLDEGWITKIAIKEDASKVFTVGQRLLRVTGRWGAFATPPHEIQQACIITVSRWFKRGLQQYQDTGAIVEVGQLTYTKALDPDVIEILRVSPKRIHLG